MFLTQGSNPCLLKFLHYRQILYCWASRDTQDGMWDIVPWPGIEPRPLALGSWGLLSHRTTISPLPNRGTVRETEEKERENGTVETKQGECIEEKWVWCHSCLVLEHISHCNHILTTYSWKVQNLLCFPHFCEVRICMGHSVVFQSKLFSKVKWRILTTDDYFNSQIKWHSVISMCWLSLFANQCISFYSQSFF